MSHKRFFPSILFNNFIKMAKQKGSKVGAKMKMMMVMPKAHTIDMKKMMVTNTKKK